MLRRCSAPSTLTHEAVVVDGLDRPEHCVVHADAPVVVQAHDTVAGGEGPPGDRHALDVDVAGLDEKRAGAGVELVDVAASQRKHDRPLALLPRLEPVGHHRGADVAGRVSEVQATFVLVAVDDGDHAAPTAAPDTQLVERRPFPRLDLSAVLGQLDHVVPTYERSEGAAGLDRGQLMVVADEHRLGAGASTWASRRASRRVSTMPASSTTTTV